MPDDLKKRGGRDRKRIDVGQDYELRDWAKKFGVSPEELRDAVAKVGDDAAKVEAQLKARKGAKTASG